MQINVSNKLSSMPFLRDDDNDSLSSKSLKHVDHHSSPHIPFVNCYVLLGKKVDRFPVATFTFFNSEHFFS